MTGLSARYRTLGELKTELRSRLGFVTQGAAANANDELMSSFLQEAHEFVFGELQPAAQRKKCVIQTVVNSYLYDWHNDAEDEDIDPGHVLSVWIKTSDTIRTPLIQGITEANRSLDSLRMEPERYDHLNGQMEVWPIPSAVYDIVVEYLAPKARFTQANDRPSVPDRLVFLYALATAKAHFRHPDAQPAAASFQSMLSREKTKQKEGRRYFASSGQCDQDLQVVRASDGSYRLRV